MKKIMTLATVAIMMAACNNETEGLENTSKYITIEADMAGESRVAAKDAFANGDAISVYAWTGESTTLPTGGFVVENSTNTFDGTSWTASPQMLWKDGTTAHHFLSIFPARAITDKEYSLEDDGDLLVAISKDVAPSSNPVSLAFNHVMAKLRVNLTFRNQWSPAPTVTGVNTTAQTAATVEWLPTTVTATGDATSVSIPAITANTTYEALLVPQTCNVVNIIIDEETYTYTGSITLVSGKVTTLNLNVGRDKVTLASEITINGWGDNGEPITGEAQ